MKEQKNVKEFFIYFQTIHDVYKILEDYNPTKKR